MAHQSDQPRSEAFLKRAMADWGDSVYRLALSQTHSRTDAEDVYQDVFLRLFNSETAFQSNEHLKAWLLRVTANRCHDLARSGWKRRTVAFDPAWDTPDTPARNAEDAAVWDAVGQLPDQQREAVHLHYVEGYSTEDIARIMDCRPATARTWLFRARARIKDLMESTSSPSEAEKDDPHLAPRLQQASPRGQPQTSHASRPLIPLRKEASHDQRPAEPLPINDARSQGA
ncbi:MAG: RNA polymerase sigma factor [Gordonibacter sp.]|uniref:RNA polymerase sigma factor n=1 Tax=Gordonibacter sp. TaxID=1968902 RepID=UPI002FCC246D